jgi:hypothetical protein
MTILINNIKQPKEKIMKPIQLNFSLPKEAYVVRELNGKFYVDNINGNFNHEFWEELKFMAKSKLEDYHSSVLFETKEKALMYSEIAKTDHAIYKVKEMRTNRAITKEQHQDAMIKLTAILFDLKQQASVFCKQTTIN